MSTRLEKRVQELEQMHGAADNGPRIIFLASPQEGAQVSLGTNGASITRQPGETEQAFISRAEYGLFGESTGPLVVLPTKKVTDQ